MDPTLQAVLGFFTLLFLPFLGVLGLLKKRALPWILWFTIFWSVLGWLLLDTLELDDPAREPLARAWRTGVVLGLAFFALAWLLRRPKVARGLKLVFGALALWAFLRALYLYVHAYT